MIDPAAATAASDAPADTSAGRRFVVVDSALRVGLVALLVYACARIMAPFITVILWSIILAVMLYPLHRRLSRRVGNRWSASLIGVVGVTALTLPLIIAAASIAGSVSHLVDDVQSHSIAVPPPPPRLMELPVVGPKLSEAWRLVSENTPAAVAKYGPQINPIITRVAKASGALAVDMLLFVVSLIIADILLAYGETAAKFARDLFTQFTGDRRRGENLVNLTVKTIRGVAQGVIGVALIQSMLIGIGFFAIGLPGAGLFALLALLIGIVQLPAALVTLPAVVYVFYTHDTTPAIIFAVYAIFAGLSDNILKPLMLGRGIDVPMPVILIGVIGGMLVDGLVGLFIGPVVLAVGYVLFVEWVHQPLPGSPPRP